MVSRLATPASADEEDQKRSCAMKISERKSLRFEAISAPDSGPQCPDNVAADAGVSPEPAADPTDVKRIKAAVGIPRQTSSPTGSPNSLTGCRRVRQSGQNQEARSSVSSWRRGAARQAGTHGNRVARPIFQTARPLQRLVGELVDEDLFVSQVESKTVDVHGIDLFGSPAAPALSRQRCCLSNPAPEGIVV